MLDDYYVMYPIILLKMDIIEAKIGCLKSINNKLYIISSN